MNKMKAGVVLIQSRMDDFICCKVIAIEREFARGGSEIGEKLAAGVCIVSKRLAQHRKTTGFFPVRLFLRRSS